MGKKKKIKKSKQNNNKKNKLNIPEAIKAVFLDPESQIGKQETQYFPCAIIENATDGEIKKQWTIHCNHSVAASQSLLPVPQGVSALLTRKEITRVSAIEVIQTIRRVLEWETEKWARTRSESYLGGVTVHQVQEHSQSQAMRGIYQLLQFLRSSLEWERRLPKQSNRPTKKKKKIIIIIIKK